MAKKWQKECVDFKRANFTRINSFRTLNVSVIKYIFFFSGIVFSRKMHTKRAIFWMRKSKVVSRMWCVIQVSCIFSFQLTKCVWNSNEHIIFSRNGTMQLDTIQFVLLIDGIYHENRNTLLPPSQRWISLFSYVAVHKTIASMFGCSILSILIFRWLFRWIC